MQLRELFRTTLRTRHYDAYAHTTTTAIEIMIATASNEYDVAALAPPA